MNHAQNSRFIGTHPNNFSIASEKLLERTPKSFPLHSKNISSAVEKLSERVVLFARRRKRLRGF